jgi:hypothetical protein
MAPGGPVCLLKLIGWIAPRTSSELIPPVGPPFNPHVIATTARIHEEAGFDRALSGYFSTAPDGFLIGAHAATVTRRLAFLLAHRPGFMAPTVAARKLATLDQLTGGRTDREAWDRARAILAKVKARQQGAAPTHRTRDRCGCWRPRPSRRSTTGACGQRWPRSQTRGATLRH